MAYLAVARQPRRAFPNSGVWVMGAKKKEPDEPPMLGQWNGLIRRARIGRDHKVAALVMSSYADSDGGGIYLSPARYAVDLEVSYSTARRYLAWLRDVGLVEMTRAGNRRKHTASEWRLILGPDVMERLEVLSPAQQKGLADAMRETERAGTAKRTERMKASDQRSSEVSVDSRVDSEADEANEADSQPINAHQERALIDPINAQMAPDQRSPWMTYTPSRTHLSVEGHPSRADDEDLRTAVTGPRAPDAETTPGPAPSPRCAHGFKPKCRPDGRPACALCRVAEDRPAVYRPPPHGGLPLADVIPLDSRRTS